MKGNFSDYRIIIYGGEIQPLWEKIDRSDDLYYFGVWVAASFCRSCNANIEKSFLEINGDITLEDIKKMRRALRKKTIRNDVIENHRDFCISKTK